MVRVGRRKAQQVGFGEANNTSRDISSSLYHSDGGCHIFQAPILQWGFHNLQIIDNLKFY